MYACRKRRAGSVLSRAEASGWEWLVDLSRPCASRWKPGQNTSGNSTRSGLYQLFGRFDELVNRVLAIQLGMGNLVYRSSVVENETIQAAREALQHLWHTFASLSVNLNTELAQVLLEDLERLAQEQASSAIPSPIAD